MFIKQFKCENTLFFLKNLLANSSFLIFPNKNFRILGFFGIITYVECRRAILYARAKLCAPTVVYACFTA